MNRNILALVIGVTTLIGGGFGFRYADEWTVAYRQEQLKELEIRIEDIKKKLA